MASTLPELPLIPDTDPSRCILDSFRTSIAKRLTEALPLTLEQAYNGVDYGKKGEDFTVALPRFRLPGKIDEVAKKVIEKVCSWSGNQAMRRSPLADPRSIYIHTKTNDVCSSSPMHG